MDTEQNFKPTEKEITENVIGVGALVVTPDFQFLTVEELRTKRSTRKIAGMRTAPMETVFAGESDDKALTRLFQEEVVFNGTSLPLDKKVLLCKIQLTRGIWLHGYLLQIEQPSSVVIGTEGNEVANPVWTNIDEVIYSDPNEWLFRPGVRELILSYLNYLANPQHFSTQHFFQTRGEVPSIVFDFLEV